ncbi:MAG: hypothetical protein IKT67_12575 [Lachnospiraceae bacterium]|nr:hypothetical protein [Lachnospiraceae bacterium]
MKKVNWKLLLLVAAGAVVLSFLLGGLCALIFRSKTVFIAVTIIAAVGSLMYLFIFNIGTNAVTKRIMDKTIAKNAEANGFGRCSTFTTHNAVIKINEQTGKIAYVCNLNPTEFQVISAKDITDIKSDYNKAPMGGTTNVYFQFVYKGTRICIPTFTAIHCVYSLQSGEVLEGISKADAYAELLERAKNAAV